MSLTTEDLLRTPVLASATSAIMSMGSMPTTTYRDTHHQHYNQFAAGLEALGKIWDFRINGYLPLGRRNSKFYHTKFDKFEDHYLYLSRKKEVSMKGANAEVGFHIDHFKDFPFYIAGGPYYLHGTGRTTWGGQLRARVDIFDYLTLEGNVSYDHIFRWIGQGQIGVNIPFGTRRKICQPQSMALSTRALQRVDRFEIIPVDTKRFHEKAIDPVTGDPYVFFFVDNTSHSLGTFESPFNTLMDAQLASGPNNVIIVYVGDGTTMGMDSGITLQNGQRLWGSVVPHVLPTTVGHIRIPTLQTGGPWVMTEDNATFALLPIISNSHGDVVTIGSNNEISGLQILHTIGSGIATPITQAVANLTVDRCTIQGYELIALGLPFSDYGFKLIDLGGTLLAQSNRIVEPLIGFNLTSSASSLTAVLLNNSLAGGGDVLDWDLSGSVQGTLMFDRNQASVGAFASNYAFNFTQSDSSTLAATLTNNQILSAYEGLFFSGGGFNTFLSITGNTFNTSLNAIDLEPSSGSLIAVITGNQLISVGGYGIYLSAGGSDATLTASENMINGFADIFIDQTAGSLSALIADNRMISAFGPGESGSGGSGIYITAGGSSASLNITGNNIDTTYSSMVITQSTGTLTGTIDSNQLASMFQDGLDVTATGTQNLTVANNRVTDAQFSGTGTAGFSFSSSGTTVWNIIGNNFFTLSEPAVSLTTTGGSLCLEFNTNTALPLQFVGEGTYQFTNSGGTFTYNPLIGNTGQFSLTGTVEQGTCQ